jgi:uncharacterized protein DUF6448
MITVNRIAFRRSFAVIAAAVALTWGTAAQAHCDTLDGPVVSEARKALDTGNVNLVLGWVQKKDEAEIRGAFQKAVAVRKSSPAGKELADTYFFETLVRVHRAGEGAPYTGLKPAGEIEPAIAAADRSIETGKLEPVAKMVIDRTKEGLHKQFDTVTAKKKYSPNDVAAGREFVNAYVEYVHYVERLYDAAGTAQHAAHAQEKPAAATVQHAAHAQEKAAAPKAQGHSH